MAEEIATPVVSTPTGRLDHGAGAALVEEIKQHIGQNETHHIIDLRAVEEVDARTVRAMIKIKRRVSDIGGSVRLVITNSKALRYIRLTALGRVFGVFSTPAAALADHASTERDAPRTGQELD